MSVHTRGGVLVIDMEEGEGVRVYLNGPAKWVYSGEIDQWLWSMEYTESIDQYTE